MTTHSEGPLAGFTITRRWPAADPTKLQLYSRQTANGHKVSIALEEMGLPYEAHLVEFRQRDQFTPEFLALNPNNKIPAILDPDGPGGKPLALFESGAILIYLAEKSGRFLPATARYEVMQWLMWQMAGLGPMIGQLGWFHDSDAGKAISDPRAKERYRVEVVRLLDVLEAALAGREWIAGEYSIADMAIAPWLRYLVGSYNAGGITHFYDRQRVVSYMDRFLARPAVQRGLAVPRRG